MIEIDRESLIVDNLRLVGSIAVRYRSAGADFDDLYQEGCKGLIRAAELFDSSMGHKFSTYATCWIRNFISRAAYTHFCLVRIPEGKLRELKDSREFTTRVFSLDSSLKSDDFDLENEMRISPISVYEDSMEMEFEELRIKISQALGLLPPEEEYAIREWFGFESVAPIDMDMKQKRNARYRGIQKLRGSLKGCA